MTLSARTVLLLWGLLAGGTLETPPAHFKSLNGNYTRLPNGMFVLHNSPPKNSQDHNWEDQNKTVLCNLKSEFDSTLIHNCTRDSLTLKTCQEVTYFSCHSPDESVDIMVKFQINCSKYTEIPEGTKSLPEWAVVLLTIGLFIAVGVLVYLFCRFKERCNRSVRGVAFTRTVQQEPSDAKNNVTVEETSPL